MEKIRVVICTGTCCHVMGADALMDIKEIAEKKFGDAVEVDGSPCFGLCKNNSSQGPFVMIDDEAIPEATVAEVVRVLETRLKK